MMIKTGSGTAVSSWQSFLISEQTNRTIVGSPVKNDGFFGPKTRTATVELQGAMGLAETGVVDKATIYAVNQKYPTLNLKYDGPLGRTSFVIGPDRVGSLREHRPYFLIPVDEDQFSEPVKPRINSWITDKIITDVYVISHGWHYTIYEAISGYDRTISRLYNLFGRGRIVPDKTYEPLFLVPHWHSDPGPNSFFDSNGKRHKDDFLVHANQLFEAVEDNCNFTDDFTDIFAFLSQIAAPNAADLLNSSTIDTIDQGLYLKLKGYKVRDAAQSLPEELAATVWRCYNETSPQGLLLDQDSPPGEFLSVGRAFSLLLSMVLVLLPVVGGAGAVLSFTAPRFVKVLEAFIAKTPLNNLWQLLEHSLRADAIVALIFLVLSFIYLQVEGNGHEQFPTASALKKRRGNVIAAAIAWITLQIPTTVFVLLFCLCTFPFGSYLQNWILWSERNGKPGKPPDPNKTVPTQAREYIVGVARWPLKLVMCATATDSTVYSTAKMIDRQLAVAEMQRKGVESGQRLAFFLEDVIQQNPQLQSAKLHLIGHSFGGVLVSNAARTLVYSDGFTEMFSAKDYLFDTVCTVQGAMASSWFELETLLRSRIHTLAAVFTRYDTATGFMYSFGFQGRLGLGSVGLFIKGLPIPLLGHDGAFTTLVNPPDLKQVPANSYLLNLDASRFEYQGPPLEGGAHSDIFKDDLVNLIWSVARL